MWVRVLDPGALGCRLHELGKAVARKWPALRHEHEFVGLPVTVERPQHPQITTVERLARAFAVLEPRHGNVRPPPVNIAPAQSDKLARTQAMMPSKRDHQAVTLPVPVLAGCF